jgi:hypothetical protein
MRSMEELSNVIYGKKEKPAGQGEEPGADEAGAVAGAEAEEPKPPRTDAELAKAIYGPAPNPRYPDSEDGGHVKDCLRDTGGRLLVQGDYCGDLVLLAQRNSESLGGADLSEMDFARKQLTAAHLHDSDLSGATFEGGSLARGDLRAANLSGTNLKGCDLKFADLRGATFDENSDISGADFAGVLLDEETYGRLMKAKGFQSARNLHRPRK